MIAALIARLPGYTWRIDEDLLVIPILGIAAATVIVLTKMNLRAKELRRRMDVFEQAVRNPNVSPETQLELLRGLRPTPGRWPFIMGWFGLFGGISWLCTEPRGDEFTMAVVATVMSFSLLTLPLAMRELEARRT